MNNLLMFIFGMITGVIGFIIVLLIFFYYMEIHEQKQEEKIRGFCELK